MIESPSILVFGACAYTPCGKFSGTDPNLSVFLFMLLFQYSARLFGSYARNPPVRDLLRVPGSNMSFLCDDELYVCAESRRVVSGVAPFALGCFKLRIPSAAPQLGDIVSSDVLHVRARLRHELHATPPHTHPDFDSRQLIHLP